MGKLSASARKRHLEARPAARLAADTDRTAMRLDDGLDKAQAQAKAPFSAARIAAKQAVPDVRYFVGRDAGSRVTDAEKRPIPVPVDFDEHMAAGRRIFH